MKSASRFIFISLIGASVLIFSNCYKNEQQGQKKAQVTTQAKTVLFSVKGMTCQSCANGIKLALLALEGIDTVDIVWDQEIDNVKVAFNPDKISIEQIKEAIVATKKEVISQKEV